MEFNKSRNWGWNDTHFLNFFAFPVTEFSKFRSDLKLIKNERVLSRSHCENLNGS